MILFHLRIQRYGSSEIRTYTDAPDAVTAGGLVWDPVPIRCGDLVWATRASQVMVTLPPGVDIPVGIRHTVQIYPVEDLTGYPASLALPPRHWRGDITDITYTDTGTQLRCTSPLSLLGGTVCTGAITPACRWEWAGPQCGATESSANSVVTAILGPTRLSSPAFNAAPPWGTHVGARIRVGTWLGLIASVDYGTGVATVTSPMPYGLGPLSPVEVWPQCRKTPADCAAVPGGNNLPRYGGFAAVPPDGQVA